MRNGTIGNYSDDRAFSELFSASIKRIVGPLLLEKSTFEMDTKHATDFLVFIARDMRIAARVRRRDKFYYPDQFTMRFYRENQVETEYHKILKGWADWMFYGWEDSFQNNGAVDRWMVVDLDSFRYHWSLRSSTRDPCIRFGIKSNRNDNERTSFIWFDITTFRSSPPLLVAKSWS